MSQDKSITECYLHNQSFLVSGLVSMCLAYNLGCFFAKRIGGPILLKLLSFLSCFPALRTVVLNDSGCCLYIDSLQRYFCVCCKEYACKSLC